MNFKKILAFLLAMMMVLSFAACGETEDKGDDNSTTTAPQETEPQETEPAETEPQLAEITFFTLSMTDAEGNAKSIFAYPNEDGTAHVDYVNEITKRGELDGNAMATIAQAFAASGLMELNGLMEGEYSEVCGSMYVSFSDDTTVGADFYGEIPEAFLNGYAAMEACLDTLTADMEEYVPAPVESGEIAESDKTALDAILIGLTLETPDAFTINGFAKDEFFAASLGLSSDEGVVSGLSFAPMMTSVAYGLNIVTLEEGADAEAVAEDFKNNIDWLKLICVQPDEAMIATKDNQVLCLVGSEEFYQMTVAAIEAAGWTTYTTLQNPNI